MRQQSLLLVRSNRYFWFEAIATSGSKQSFPKCLLQSIKYSLAVHLARVVKTLFTMLGRDRSYYDIRQKPHLPQKLNIQLARKQLQTPHFLEISSRKNPQTMEYYYCNPNNVLSAKTKIFWRCQFPFKSYLVTCQLNGLPQRVLMI